MMRTWIRFLMMGVRNRSRQFVKSKSVLYRQLKQMAHQQGWRENAEPARYEEIHKAILAGLLSHVAQKDDKRDYLAARNRPVTLFPGSTLSSRPPDPESPRAGGRRSSPRYSAGAATAARSPALDGCATIIG